MQIRLEEHKTGGRYLAELPECTGEMTYSRSSRPFLSPVDEMRQK